MRKYEKELPFEEAHEQGMAAGLRQGMAQGMAAGLEKGLTQGIERGTSEVARNALAAGASPDFVQKITGLSAETIENIAKG